MNNILQGYRNRINENNIQRNNFRVFQKYFPLARLITFIGSGFLIYHSVATHNNIYLVAFVAIFISFLVLGWLDILYKAKINRIEMLNEINQNEINSMQGDYSGNEAGEEFTNMDHPYTFDLDIFGNKSLFQCINRTSTIFGKRRLAAYFQEAYHYSKDIAERREAIEELSKNIQFRLKILLIFNARNTREYDLTEMSQWLNSDLVPSKRLNLYAVFLYLLNGIAISSVILFVIGIIPGNIFWIPIVFQLLFASRFGRVFMKMHDVVTKKFRILGKYAQCLEHIENTDFTSPMLSKLKATFTCDGRCKPGKVVNHLFQIINFMDSNLNILLAFILNGLFTINLHLLIGVEKWKNNYRDLIPQWFDILGEMDALSSLGNFAFNNPDYSFPEVAKEGFVFSATNIGHPLIEKNTCVKNDVEIDGWKKISIITGANMSGKSTLLRTIGTNFVLAMTGAPVCAEKLIFSPVELHTSMRTNDNLAKRESYFYAELKRLKEIIDDLEKGIPKFILLDEILKGTNSIDKRNGSMALVSQFTHYNVAVMVATHDQILGELKNEYTANISNYCFEISIVNDTMQIDYKIREGICKNLNATFLMKNMGIILPEKIKRN